MELYKENNSILMWLHIDLTATYLKKFCYQCIHLSLDKENRKMQKVKPILFLGHIRYFSTKITHN